MENKDRNEARDLWGKIEILGKLLAGMAAILGLVLIPMYLSKQAEENRKVQVYAEIMSQREAKDTEIRAKMFETLLTNYLKISSDIKPSPSEFNEKIVFLSLLMDNFQEYFGAGPLFEDLYRKISIEKEKCINEPNCKEKWDGFQPNLINLAKSTASKQITMLSRAGLVSSDKINIKTKCASSTYIPLFEIKEKGSTGKIKEGLRETLKKLEDNENCEDLQVGQEKGDDKKDKKEWWEDEDNITLRMSNTSKKLYTIRIKVEEIEDPEVKVSVSLYEYTLVEGPDPTVKSPWMFPVKKEPFDFYVSYFDMPYTDNTRLFEGDRFALILKAICKGNHIGEEEECRAVMPTKPKQLKTGKDKEDTKNVSQPFAIFQVITFKEEFMSLRDRPLFEEILNKLQSSK